MPLTFRQSFSSPDPKVATLSVISFPTIWLKSIWVEFSAIRLRSNVNRVLNCSLPLNAVTSNLSAPSGGVTCKSRFACVNFGISILRVTVMKGGVLHNDLDLLGGTAFHQAR